MMKKQILFGIALIVIILSANSCTRNKPGIRTYDVVIYGGTPAGIAAAIQVAREGKTVVLLEPSDWAEQTSITTRNFRIARQSGE
jgi:alkyl hydroperoxide reductase subunit AhpF